MPTKGKQLASANIRWLWPAIKVIAMVVWTLIKLMVVIIWGIIWFIGTLVFVLLLPLMVFEPHRTIGRPFVKPYL